MKVIEAVEGGEGLLVDLLVYLQDSSREFPIKQEMGEFCRIGEVCRLKYGYQTGGARKHMVVDVKTDLKG